MRRTEPRCDDVCGYANGVSAHNDTPDLGYTYGATNEPADTDALQDAYARNCAALARPGVAPASRKPGRVPGGLEFQGVPVDHEMESFKQPFEQCPTDREGWNRYVKDRLLAFGNGPVALQPPPAIKPCVPEKVSITRQSNGPCSTDGVPDFTPNLRNPSIEGVLLGVGKGRHGQQGLDSMRMAFEREVLVCAPQYQAARQHSEASIAGAFSVSAVTNATVGHQLDHINSEVRGSLFRNNSRSKFVRK